MKTSKENLRNLVYSVFSDTLMIFLALLIIPVLAIQFLYPLTETQELVIAAIDWIIWIVFFLEFVFKVYAGKDIFEYVRANRLDSLISVIIIVSPVLELLATAFAGAALLRLLRISRLVRLAGVAGKVGTKWRRINFKSYALVAVIIAIGFLVSLFKPALQYSANDAAWLTVFVSLIGVIYAVIAAFTIMHVWNEFNAMDSEIRKEAVHLRNLVLLADRTNQKSFGKKIKERILEYVSSNVDKYWKKTASMEDNRRKFVQIMESIDEFTPRNEKEIVVLDNVIEELRETASTRSNITTLVNSKTPNIVWLLLVFLSFVLVTGISLMDFQSQLLSTMTITLITTAIAFVTLLVYDMDFPFQSGFWVISPQPYFEVEEFIKRSRDGQKNT